MFKYAIKKPFSVGALASSSSRLVKNITSHVPSDCSIIVELGAGTGVITKPLGQKGCKVVSVEIDDSLATETKKIVSNNVEVVVGDAIEVDSFVGGGDADCIVCSLPLTLFSEGELKRLLESSRKVLKEGGVFVFYMYRVGVWWPKYGKVLDIMKESFSNVSPANTTWLNFPPARVIVCC